MDSTQATSDRRAAALHRFRRSRRPCRIRRTERGQGLVEYAIMLALVAIAVVVALTFTGDRIADTLEDVGSSLGNPGASSAPSKVVPRGDNDDDD